MPLISVFTPTYNRANKIHRVYTSLLNQTLKDFEWIIVDDGSKDNTKAVVEEFIRQQPGFPIHYFYQANAGKHVAINHGLSMATCEWFHIADSDDELVPETLEVFMKTWNDIPVEKRINYCGVAACCRDQFGKRISDQVPGGVFDGGFRELFYKYKFRKEVFMINKTAMMREFPFPEHIRNVLVPEALTWRRMTDKYKLRFINDEMRIYYVDEPNSLTSIKQRSPRSKALSSCLESGDVLNFDLRYFIFSPLYFFRMALVYHSFWPFLNNQERKWVFLKPFAKTFAFPFIFAGWAYSRIMMSRFQKKLVV